MNEPCLYRRSSGPAEPITSPTLWRAFTGYGLWAMCFTVLYTGHALGCAWVSSSSSGAPASSTTVTGVLAGIWLSFVFLQLVLTAHNGVRLRSVPAEAQRQARRFMVALTFIADASAVVVTVISGLPIILTKACI